MAVTAGVVGLTLGALTGDADRIDTAAPATSTTVPTTSSSVTTPAAPAPSSAPPPAPPPAGSGSFADVYRDVHDGVVRIDSELCGSSGVGTGFLVAPDMLVTAAHVVTGASSLVLTTAGVRTEGTVVGLDEGRDLALVRLDERIGGHAFELAPDRPDVGDPVALIGYPLGEPLSLATGAVSGLDRSIATESGLRRALIQTDVAANPGNSGGPLIDDEGEVLGVLVAGNLDAVGLTYAVSAQEAAPLISRWRSSPNPQPSVDCDGTGPPLDGGDVSEAVTSNVDHPDLDGLALTFQTYVDGINRGDYEAAHGVLAGRSRDRTSYEEFARENSTSVLVTFTIHSVEDVSETVDEVRVTFVSYQEPAFGPAGQDCSEWDLTYTTELIDGLWYITGASNNDPSPVPCAGG